MVWFGTLVLDGCNHHLTIVFVIIVESFFSVICSALLNDYPVTMDYMTPYLVFLSTILYIFVIMNTEANQKTCTAILMIHLAIAYIYPIANRFFPQVKHSQFLELNFRNPNTTAMWLLQAILGAWMALVVLKPIWLTALLWVTL